MSPFAILMFIFAGAILLYAGILAATGDYRLVPRGHAARPKDERAYARALGGMLAVTALAPLGSGIYALFREWLGLVMLLVNLPLCIGLGLYFFGRHFR